jgi:hypothetical protein
VPLIDEATVGGQPGGVAAHLAAGLRRLAGAEEGEAERLVDASHRRGWCFQDDARLVDAGRRGEPQASPRVAGRRPRARGRQDLAWRTMSEVGL